MVDIVLRSGKGSPLTNAELDANFSNIMAAIAAAAVSAEWVSVIGKPTTLVGYGITDAQATLVSGTNIKTINGSSILGAGDISIAGGVVSFNTREGNVTLTSTDVLTALGFTPYSASNPNNYVAASALADYLPLAGVTLTGALTVTGNLLLAANAGGSRTIGFSGGTNTTLVLQAGAATGSGANLELTLDKFAYLDADTSKLRSNDGATTFLQVSASATNVVTGVLQQNGNQVLHAANYAAYSAFTGVVSGSRMYAGYYSGVAGSVNTNNWFRTSGAVGMYYATYGRGIQPADTIVSYGNNAPYGTGLNGWQGIAVTTDNKAILMGNGTNVGIYNANSGFWLQIADSAGNTTFAGNVTAYSDLRLKENVRKIDNVIERRNTLASAAIKYERDGRTRIGYGAQLLLEGHCQEFVIEADDGLKIASGLGTLSVDYGETAAVLAVVSKLTDDRVALLEARLDVLEIELKKGFQNAS